MLKNEEFALYGTVLAGDETDLERTKLARTRYLKIKMRQRLAHEIGDDPDTITDVLRAALLCYAVNAGMVTDPGTIARLNNYVAEMIAGYGGAESILDVLELDKEAVRRHVVADFFSAKQAIQAAVSVDDVHMIDLQDDHLPQG